MAMIEIQDITTSNIQDIIDILQGESEQPFEIYAPKSTQLYFSEDSAIADDYALLAYVGQKLHDIADEFSYGYVSPSQSDSVLFEVKVGDIQVLAEVLLELSYEFANTAGDEYMPREVVYDFIDKIQKSEIVPACPDFVDDFESFNHKDVEAGV
jgi:hypothetical protein